MNIINCTDDDLNVEVNSGNPIFCEATFLVKSGSCRRLPHNKVPKRGKLKLYSDKYGDRDLRIRHDDEDSVIVAFLDADNLDARALTKADSDRSRGKTLLVNCTEDDFHVVDGGRSNDKRRHIPSWHYLKLPGKNAKKAWQLHGIKGAQAPMDLAEHWNDVLILTSDPKAGIVIAGMARMLGAKESDPSLHAVG